MLMGMV